MLWRGSTFSRPDRGVERREGRVDLEFHSALDVSIEHLADHLETSAPFRKALDAKGLVACDGAVRESSVFDSTVDGNHVKTRRDPHDAMFADQARFAREKLWKLGNEFEQHVIEERTGAPWALYESDMKARFAVVEPSG